MSGEWVTSWCHFAMLFAMAGCIFGSIFDGIVRVDEIKTTTRYEERNMGRAAVISSDSLSLSASAKGFRGARTTTRRRAGLRLNRTALARDPRAEGNGAYQETHDPTSLLASSPLSAGGIEIEDEKAGVQTDDPRR